MHLTRMLLRATLLCALGAFVGCGASAADPAQPASGAKNQPADAIKVDTAAPNATVVASDGSAVELASLWAKDNVAVVFYRGHW